MQEKLNLDNELLKPMKDRLNSSIDTLTKNAILTGKESEITLKIQIGVTKKDREWDDVLEEYLEPNYEYQLTEKIKEAKSNYKRTLGLNYSVEIDDDRNVIVKNINEQQSLFGKEN